jgi:hypothetical protein
MYEVDNQFYQYIIYYNTRQHRTFRLRGKSGEVVDFILKMLQCCLWCFEKFLAYLNRNAYIEIGKLLVNSQFLQFSTDFCFILLQIVNDHG